MNINLSQAGPRVNLAERDGIQGLRVRHQTLSIFLNRDEALEVATKIADLVAPNPEGRRVKPTPREVPAKVRRTGLHTLTLELGGQHFTGHVAEFAQLAAEIRKALTENGID